MGLAHLKAGDIEQAVDELTAAVRDYPEDAELAGALDEALERFAEPAPASGGAAGKQAGEAAPRPEAEPLPSRDKPAPVGTILMRSGRTSGSRRAGGKQALRIAVMACAVLATGGLTMTVLVPSYIEGGRKQILRAFAISKTEHAKAPASPRVADEASSKRKPASNPTTPDPDRASPRVEQVSATTDELAEAPAEQPSSSRVTAAPAAMHPTTPATGTGADPKPSVVPAIGFEARPQPTSPAPESAKPAAVSTPSKAAERAAGLPAPVAPAQADPGTPLNPAPGAQATSSSQPASGLSAPPVVATEPYDARAEPLPEVIVQAPAPPAPQPAILSAPAGLPRERLKADPVLDSMRGKPRMAPVDVPPTLKTALRIPYTSELARKGASGRALFWVLVNRSGTVEEVRMLRSSGSPELDAAAADAIRGSSYVPGQRYGRSVPAWTQQQVMGLCCRPGQTR
jgi:TonB family protein